MFVFLLCVDADHILVCLWTFFITWAFLQATDLAKQANTLSVGFGEAEVFQNLQMRISKELDKTHGLEWSYPKLLKKTAK